MATGAEAGNAVRVAFDAQVAAIQRRLERLVPTARWTDLMHSAHDRAFVVAGAMKADLLGDFAGAVDQAIRDGRSIDWFREQFDSIVDRHGWAYRGERNWRSRVIYNTNMQSSYAAGRLAQLRDPALQEVAPYWMYRHGGSADPRPDHLSWDKLVLPADDPWWKEHYPPNGWGCKCYVVAVSEAQARRLGGRLEPPPGEDPPGAIDAGWDYMPGDTVSAELLGLAEAKVPYLPAPVGAAMWPSLPASIRQVQADAFGEWADRLLQAGRAIGSAVQVGALDFAVVTALAARSIAPHSAALIVRDADVLHTYRDAKTNPPPFDWYRQLPAQLPGRQAVLLDRRGDDVALLYVFPDPSGTDGAYKMVVPVDYRLRTRDEDGGRKRLHTNVVRTGTRVLLSDLRGRYEVLDGEL